MDKINRVGEQNRADNGQMMTIIVYRNALDIDVQFEDGSLATHRHYNRFINGNIYPDNVNFNNYKAKQNNIGKTSKTKNGMIATIIDYIDYNNIIVQFENGNTIKTTMYAFKKANIYPTNIARTYYNAITNIENNAKKKIGETNIHNRTNMIMTIIDYRNSHDIDIQFEDGVIVYHKDYFAFKRGLIRHPLNEAQYKIGAKQKSTKGQIMTVIDIVDAKKGKIKVKFEDNTEVITYANAFVKGLVKNPNLKSELLNKIYKDRNGDKFEVIDYNGAQDITIRYIEDNNIYQHRSKQSIQEKKVPRGRFPYIIKNIVVEKPAYIYKNVGNFYCTCNKCGKKDIMTIEEIKQHKCIKGDYHNGIK
jgi:hypothetical protein